MQYKTLIVVLFCIILFVVGCSEQEPKECMDQCIEEGEMPRECVIKCGLGEDQKPNQADNLGDSFQDVNLPDFEDKKGFFLGFSSVDVENLGLLKESGATWVRRNRWFKNDGDIVLAGIDTDTLAENNINILNTIGFIKEWIPEDYGIFKEKLAQMINSEKEYVKYWQLGNEPDLIWINLGMTEEDYINFFLELQPVIRNECPDCKVVLAGISNQYDSGDNYESFKTILQGIKERSPDTRPFDVFDMHFYPFEGGYYGAEKAPVDYKNLLKETGYDYEIELINTELAIYSGKPLMGVSGNQLNHPKIESVTEQQQAYILIKTFTMLFNRGLTKIMWTQLVNAYKHGHDNDNEGGIWDLVGVVYNGKGSYDIENNIKSGTKKESFYSYQILASKIQGKTKSEKLADYVYKFSGDNEVYVAWNDEGRSLPEVISGKVKVTDYLGNEEVKNAEDIILNDSPVFIEII